MKCVPSSGYYPQFLTTQRQHMERPGGFVLTRERLDELVPIEPSAMENRLVIEWGKDDAVLKFLNIDLLQNHKGVSLDLTTIPAEYPRSPV
jgi:error-prone DNA polymerase